MTIHAAKGLEFDIVYLPGWEEGVFPSQRAMDEGGLAALEEERRLAYVAITRARRRATILHAANRRIYGQWTSSIPSRFLAELPKAQIRGRDDHDRRRKPVASAMVGARRSVRPSSPAPRAAPAGSAPAARPTIPSRSASSRPARQPSASATKAATICRSASACSTASSATAPSRRSKATSSKSTSSTPAARRCSTASSAPGESCA